MNNLHEHNLSHILSQNMNKALGSRFTLNVNYALLKRLVKIRYINFILFITKIKIEDKGVKDCNQNQI